MSTVSGRWSKRSLYLYAAYTSTCLEDRAWSFCVSLCMQLLGGMRIVSIEQLFEGAFQMAFSGLLGRTFDGLSRKAGIITVVPLNNLSICVAAGLFITCLSVDEGSVWFIVCLVLGMFVCAVNRLFLNAEKFVVGRDWVVVLSSTGTLSGLNATLTSLDQLANVVSPLVTGALVTFTSLRTTCAIFAVGSLVSLACKVFFLSSLFVSNPELQKRNRKSHTVEAHERKGFLGVAVTYYRQTVFLAALGMALLFMTVMGFDGLAVGYGSAAGLPEFVIGGFRSLGSIMGIAGAFSYALFENRFGVRKSGVVGFLFQQICMLLAVSSIFLPGTPMDLKGYFSNFTVQDWWYDVKHSFDGMNSTQQVDHIDWKHFTSKGQSLVSITTFLIGIAAARYGLWMADLCITQIMQVNVDEKQINTVFGVHNALCQTFSALKDVMVIILPDPSTFGLCILVSYVFVSSGHVFYLAYLIQHPNDLERSAKLKSSTASCSDCDTSEVPVTTIAIVEHL